MAPSLEHGLIQPALFAGAKSFGERNGPQGQIGQRRAISPARSEQTARLAHYAVMAIDGDEFACARTGLAALPVVAVGPSLIDVFWPLG